MGRAWVVRAGREGEQEQGNLDTRTASIGWTVGDLSAASSREDVRAMMKAAYPDDSPGRLANLTGQVWAFRSQIQPGDTVIMPSKLRPGYLYLGKCAGAYRYQADEPDAARRHQIPVEWQDEPVSKSVVKDDLLFSLNSIMTVFNPTRNNAGPRLVTLLVKGTDPGNNGTTSNEPQASGSEPGADAVEVVDPDPRPSLEAIRDQIRTHLIENFAGHKLTILVADILEALDFSCEVSPPGPDGGVDILAGRGPLGLDSPTLIVEVKSEPTAVDVKVVRGLHSAMTQHRADQGLLVAWGGVTSAAAREFRRERTSFRIWDSEELLNRLFETYDSLPPRTRARIPLKRAWVLDHDGD